MAERGEDVTSILAASLDGVWPGHSVVPGAQAGGQVWWLHPHLSLCASSPGPRARTYLRRSQRWSHRPARIVPQLLASQLIASRIGRQLSRQAAFTVRPALPNACDILVMPSNQRIRLLDFQRRRTQVLPKAGFSTQGLRTELRVRTGPGPWPDTEPFGEVGFEEALLEGWSLPRRPPWRVSSKHETQALAMVERWQAGDAETVSARAWAERVAQELERGLATTGWALPALPFDRWIEDASHLDAIEVSRSHGDLQPGNIYLTRAGEVVVLDWERASRRWRPYDRYVLEHRARWGGVPPGSHDATRRAEGALFWLEDLLFYLQDARALPFEGCPPSLVQRVEAACAWL